MARDGLKATGRYVATLRDAEGVVLWRKEFDNLLTQIGKAFLMDEALGGSSYTAAGYMGLISSVSYSVISGGDTMTSHSGWLEAGATNAPTYSGTRATLGWSAATTSGSPNYTATKQLSSAASFTFTGSGTVEGAFIVLGSGAEDTIDNTGGTLYSAGAFGSPQAVSSGNVLTVEYSTTIS